MTPAENIEIAAEIEASKRYQGIVFAQAVRIVMRRKQVCFSELARRLDMTRSHLRMCVVRQSAPLSACRIWPRLAQVLES